MKLLQELSSVVIEASSKDSIMDVIDTAIDFVDVYSMTYTDAINAIADKAIEMDSKDILGDRNHLIELIKSVYNEEDHSEVVKEDEAEGNWPKKLGAAGEFSVEVDEDEQVTLLKRNNKIVSMPLVIWKQLIRA